MDGQAFDVKHDGSEVAYCATDGVIRVWEVETLKLKNEFLPNAHLSATCTCLNWRPVKSSLGSGSQQVCVYTWWCWYMKIVSNKYMYLGIII